MLKPFRIRALLDGDPSPSASQGSRPLQVDEDSCGISNKDSDLSARYARDGIVQVTSSEYDQTVTRNPKASLRYVDDDDGESITVGSSLELAQRLDEPVPQDFSVGRRASQASGADQEMHIFDIRRTSDVLSTWRDIHMKSSWQSSCQSTSSKTGGQAAFVDGVLNINVDGPVRVPGGMASGNQASDVSDARAIWIRHCNPPQLRDGDGTSETNSSTMSETARSSQGIGEGEHQPSYMTAEGRKKANAAGATLRQSRNLLSGNQRSSFSLPSPAQNFWSSQGRSEERTDSNAECVSKQESTGNGNEPLTDEQSQPLLSAFEAELSKLISGNAASEHGSERESRPEVSQTSSTETIRPQPTEQEPTHPATPIPGEAVVQTMHSLLRGISNMTSDLTTRLPEVERRLHGLQQQIPAQMESRMSTALQGMRSHVQSLANTMQDAALSTRTAAERTRETEFLASAQVNGLRNLAYELGEVGKSLFSAFDSRNASERVASQPLPREQSSTTTQVSSAGDQEDRPRNATHPNNSSHVDLIGSQLATQPTNQLTGEGCSSAPVNPVGSNPVTQNKPAQQVSETTLFIGNLPHGVADESLRSHIASQGFVGQIIIPANSATGENGGFTYVKFPTTYAASAALQALHGTYFQSRALNVEFSLGPCSESSEFPDEGSSSIAGCGPGEGVTAQTPSQDPERRPSSLKPTIVSRSSTQKQRRSVNFADPAETFADLGNVRRAKSLASLRPRQTASNSTLENRGFPNSHAPLVPPKVPCETKGTELKEEGNVDASRNPSRKWLDQENDLADFNARYPPIPGSHGLPGAPANNEDLERRGKPVRDDNTESRTSLPGPSIQPGPAVPSQQTHTTSELAAIPLRSTRRHSDAAPARSPKPEQGPSPFPTPTVPDRLPGAWPVENEPRDRSDDWDQPVFPMRKPARRSQGPRTELQETEDCDPWAGPAFPGQAVRRSATERHRRPRHAHFGRPPRYHPGSSERRLGPSFADMPGGFPTDNRPSAPLPPPFSMEPVPQAEMMQSTERSKIDICVGHLKALGFVNGDEAILRIYAEAAGGTLENAIEMIEEERKVLEQQGGVRHE